MINRAIQIKLQLETLKVRQSSLNLYWPTETEWDELQDINELLSEFAMATTELSGQNYPTIAHVSVIFLSLMAYLNTWSDPEYLLYDIVNQMKQKLETYWNIIDENTRVLAFLDPRYKNLCFSEMDSNSVLQYFRQKLPSLSLPQSQSQAPQAQKSRMSHFVARLSNNQNISTEKDKISSYWNLASASDDIAPLDW